MNLRDELHAMAPSGASSHVTGRAIIRAARRRRRKRMAGCVALTIFAVALAASLPSFRSADTTPDSLIAPIPQATAAPTPSQPTPVPEDLGLPSLTSQDQLVDLEYVQVGPDDRTLLVQAETSPCLGLLRWQVQEGARDVAARLIREPVTGDGQCALLEDSRAQPFELRAPLADRTLVIQDGAGTRVANLRWRGKLLSAAPPYNFSRMVELSMDDGGVGRLTPSGDDVITRFFSDGGDCLWSVSQFDATVPDLPASFKLGPEVREVAIDGVPASYRIDRVSRNAVLVWRTSAGGVVVSGNCGRYDDSDLVAFARSLSEAPLSTASSQAALQDRYRRELLGVNQGASRDILTGLGPGGLVTVIVDTSAELTPRQEQFLARVETDKRLRIVRRDASKDRPFSN